MSGPGTEGGSPPWGKSRGATMGQGRVLLIRWIGRLVSTASLVGWMGFIFYLSSLSHVEAFAWLGKPRDVVGHLFLYGALGTLSMVALVFWVTGTTRQACWALLAAALGVLYGGLDEFHQSFVPGRSASAFDVMVDSVGVTLGLACTAYVVTMVLERRWIHPFGGWTRKKGQG